MATFPKANTMSQSILGAMETISQQEVQSTTGKAAVANAAEGDVYKAMQNAKAGQAADAQK